MPSDDTFRDKFRTGDALSGASFYLLPMPANLWFIAQVADALTAMTIDDNWEQAGVETVENTVAAAVAMLNGFSPLLGWIIPYAVSTLPDGFLPCDGATYLRVDYPALYDVLDSAFIVDADHFKTPLLSNRTIVGAGDTYAVGETGGEAEHTLSSGEMPVHNHGIYTSDSVAVTPGELPVKIPFLTTVDATANAGGGGAHNNMQPFQALKYAIVAR